MKLTPWTQAQIDDFVQWHEKRLSEPDYNQPLQKVEGVKYYPTVAAELREARDKFINGVRSPAPK